MAVVTVRRPGSTLVGLAVISALAAVTLTPAAVVPAAAEASPDLAAAGRASVGMADPAHGRWVLANNAGQGTAFYYGDAGDVPFMGDWDCDGIDTPGLYRQGDGRVYLRNRNDQGNADVWFYFGDPGDVPLAGDFDGDGCDTVSLYRPATGRVYVINQLGADGHGLGAADFHYPLGEPGDVPLAGDFNGDGVDTVGTYRPEDSTFSLPDHLGPTPPSRAFAYGDTGDRPLVGDWAGQGVDTVGVYRPGSGAFYLRHRNDTGRADEIVPAPGPGHPVAGVFGLDRPNVVVILVDDQRYDELEHAYGRSLPGWDSALERELVAAGTTFPNHFLTTPLCCPSRAAMLTGRYGHNNGVWGNSDVVGDQNGGFQGYVRYGGDAANLGVWMQDAGYTTGYVGKLLNGFLAQHTPTGWDEWSIAITHQEFDYFAFTRNENGVAVEYGQDEPAYLTDVDHRHAVAFLDRHADRRAPFLLFVSPYAPHGPVQPPPRHHGLHDCVADFAFPFEHDLSDKPQHIRDGAEEQLGWGCIGHRRMDITLAVDELIGGVVAALERAGALEDTYLFFTSDNGLVVGEHQIGGKANPYEPAIRFPLIVRGPDIAAGKTQRHLVANIDLAPTLLDLAGAPLPPEIDGASLVGPMTGRVPSAEWRSAVLLELLAPVHTSFNKVTIPPFAGLRTRQHTYVEYATGETELYDLRADPHQLESRHATADPALIDRLARQLDRLRDCSGADCRTATGLPG